MKISPFLMISFTFFSSACYTQPGSPDNTFGTNGKVITVIGSQSNAISTVLQTDGKLLVAGFAQNSNYDMVVARYNTDGSLDASFGSGGIVSTALTTGDDVVTSIAIQPDGKIVVGGHRNYQFSLLRYDTDGALDATFGNNGIVVTSLAGRGGVVESVVLQEDGKILAGGSVDKTTIPDGSDFALVRYNSDGSLDATFDGDGIVITNINPAPDYVRSIAVQNDGKIVAAGSAGTANSCGEGCYSFTYDVAIIRYNSDGSIDNTFNGNGKKIIDFGGFEQLVSIKIQPDGKIVGVVDNGLVLRFNNDGSFDNTFGGNGVINFQSRANDISVDSGGKIVVAGGSGDFVVGKYHADGSIDNSFDGDGTAEMDFGGNDQSTKMAVTSDRIYLVGSTFSNGANQIAVAAFSNSSLDVNPPVITSGPGVSAISCNSATILWTTDEASTSAVSFNDGVHYFNQSDPNFVNSHDVKLSGLSPGTTYFYAVISSDSLGNRTISNEFSFTTSGNEETTYYQDFDKDGYGNVDVVIQSCTQPEGYVSNDEDCDDNDPTKYPGVIKDEETPTVLDVSFGNNGTTIQKHVDGVNFVASAIQSDGKLIAYGYTANADTTRTGLLVRYNTDGSTDNSFGENGVSTILTHAYSSGTMSLQSDGKIVVAGTKYSATISNTVCAVSRYNADGTPDESFGSGGEVSMNFEGRLVAMSKQSDGKIVAAGIANNKLLIIRLDQDGSFDHGFNGNGIVQFDGIDLNGIFIQQDGKILVAGSKQYQSPLVKRFNADGSPDNSFALDPNTFVAGFTVASNLQPDGKLLLLSKDFDVFYYTLSRFNRDGTPDASFGSGGIAYSEPDETITKNSIILQPDGKILIGGQQGSDFLMSRYYADGSIDSSFANNGKSRIVAACGYGMNNSLSVTDNRAYGVGSITSKRENIGSILAYRIQWDLICPQNKIVNTDSGQCKAIVNNIDPAVYPLTLVNYSLSGQTTGGGNGSASGLVFNKGVTTVTYTSVDDETKTCSFTVTVVDTEKPVLIAPDPDITVNTDAGKCSASISDLGAPQVTDNCGIIAEFNNAPRGYVFPKGVTTVTWTDVDASGNQVTSTQTITVVDKEPPVFTCPPDRTVNLLSNCKFLIPDLITGLTGTDNCSGVTFTQTPVANTLLDGQHNGVYEVIVTGMDEDSNVTSCIVHITAKDVSPPEVTSCPSDMTLGLDGNCQITVPDITIGLTGTDNCGTVTFSQSIAPGTLINAVHNGRYNVSVTASDGNGNSVFCTALLTAIDTIPPSFSVPANRNVNLTSNCQLIVPDLISGLQGIDNCGAVSYTQSPVAGTAIGSSQNSTHNIVISADDGHGNTATATVILTAKDNTPPTVVIAPVDITVSTDPGKCIASNVSLGNNVSFTDNCPGTIVTTDAPAVFPKGTTAVTWTATDVAGNTATAIQKVTVVDTESPVIVTNAPAVTVYTDAGKCSAYIPELPNPQATDNCGIIAEFNDAPSDHIFPKGITIVTWSEVDAAGNTTKSTQPVTVLDNEVPLAYCPIVPIQCYNANGTYSIPALTATDNCGIQSISYTISGATTRSGNSSNASGSFDPGASTIIWNVTDESGNPTTCATSVVIDKVDAAIPDAYAANITPSMGAANTIYIGYGGTSITLSAQVSSSVSPNSYTYKWTIGSPGGTKIGTGSSVTVSPTTTTTYYLSIKDNNNCAPLYQVSKQINVVNIVCGTNKVYVCQFKNGSYSTICTSSTTKNINSLPTGSYLGQCGSTLLTVASKANGKEESLVQKLEVTASPNPTNHSFNITVHTKNEKEKIALTVIDVLGRVVENRNSVIEGQIFKLGENYRPGIYLIEAIQGKQRKTITVIKMPN